MNVIEYLEKRLVETRRDDSVADFIHRVNEEYGIAVSIYTKAPATAHLFFLLFSDDHGRQICSEPDKETIEFAVSVANEIAYNFGIPSVIDIQSFNLETHSGVNQKC